MGGKGLVSYLAAAVAGVVGGALGWLLVAAGFFGGGSLFGVADRDGGFAMSVFFGLGPIGAVAGLLLGVWLTARRFGRTGALALLQHLSVAVVMVVALAGSVAAGFWLSQPYVSPGGLPPELIFEIRLPREATPPALVSRSDALARRSPIELQTSQNSMAAEIEKIRIEDGHPIVVGRVEMHYRVRDRLLVLKLSGGHEVVFDVRLAAKPVGKATFGDWQSASRAPGGNYAIRYRTAWEDR